MAYKPSDEPMSHPPAYYQNRTIRAPTKAERDARQACSVQQPPAHNVLHGETKHGTLLSRRGEESVYSILPYPPLIRSQSTSSTSISGRSRIVEQRFPHPYSLSSYVERGLSRYEDRTSNETLGFRHNPRPGNTDSASEHDTLGHRGTENTNIQGIVNVQAPADHALQILGWLSCLDSFYSFFSCCSTVVVLLLLLLISPLGLLRPTYSLSASSVSLLSPLLQTHLRMLCAEPVEGAHDFDYDAGKLIAIHLLCPILSIGVTMASWIGGAFWVFALMMGNPDGTERQDDGRIAILLVRDWWQRLLLRALREE